MRYILTVVVTVMSSPLFAVGRWEYVEYSFTSDGMSQNGGPCSVLTKYSVSSNSCESIAFDGSACDNLFTNRECVASPTSSGLLLNRINHENGFYEKEFILNTNDFRSCDAYDSLSVNGGSNSVLTSSSQTGCADSLIYRVADDSRMPVSPKNLYGLGNELKAIVRQEEFLSNGCYVYLGEPMGVGSNVTYAALPTDCHRLFVRFFEQGGDLRTLRVDGCIDNIERVDFCECSNLCTLVAWDIATARAIIERCSSITNLVLIEGVTRIDDDAFEGCENLVGVTVPSSVITVGNRAFARCSRLTALRFSGDAPEIESDALAETPRRLSILVPNGSIGWEGGLSESLPSDYLGKSIAHSQASVIGNSGGDASLGLVMSVTNVVIHYICQSAYSDLAVPITKDTAIVNVMTEIKGGTLAIPDSWSANYPGFAARFGTDFSTALTSLSGKRDSGGNSLFVWQDYVAGTDPTDENDVFKASVTVVDGKPIVSWTPELNESEAAKRRYTTYGKKSLLDENWCVVPTGHEGDYNFFKVTVEMK